VSPKVSPKPSPKVSPKPSPKSSPRPSEPSEEKQEPSEEKQEPSTEVLTSKQYYQQAARLLMEFSSRADFSETNGEQVLSMVQYLLS
jgi:outer membrane biosynthesis protein TonB